MRRPDNKRPMAYVLLRKYGFKGACRILLHDVGFDLRHRVNTATPMSQRQLFGRNHSSDLHRYVASTFDVMRSTLDYVSMLHDLSECGFVDLGSGKGKALIAASRYPFKSLQGVELSARINAIACANLKRLGLDKRVALFEGAAADYSFQPHERIIYFFNSFSGDALHSLLNNLAASPRIGPGVLIYTNPTERSDIEKYFTCIHHEFIDPGHCEVSYYRLPASS